MDFVARLLAHVPDPRRHLVHYYGACLRSGSVTVSDAIPPGSFVYLIPAVVHSPGDHGSPWRSDVAAVNRSPAASHVTLTFTPVTGAPMTRMATVSGLGTREWVDILTSLLGYEDSAPDPAGKPVDRFRQNSGSSRK